MRLKTKQTKLNKTVHELAEGKKLYSKGLSGILYFSHSFNFVII